ncbi:hypothetical protein C2E25_12880 [Geothermobacter hydrogeniphilus]|uniref:Uncharacterized protein n=1 Tax=Geothermobacter hydrogeniphilus TaxID=1969733 RepID=A0A2K2H7Y7_9BACT|nr:hypothetical protein C2E25_12880 [Geothermobacter hydrogeniphilus]
MVRRLLVVALLLFTGCAGLKTGGQTLLEDRIINTDTVWQGDYLIDGKVRVVGGATLTIKPGTRLFFVRRDRDRDGLGDAAIEVEHASLLALGTVRQPIEFRSAENDPRPGDWLEIKVDFARKLQLSHCLIRDSAHGLHAHFSKGSLEDSVLRNNIDGTRFGQGRYVVRRCLVVGNRGKGLNFRNSEMEIRDNILRGNRAGLFIFETDRPLTVVGNNFVANRHHVRLGDFFRGDIKLGRNWFGTRDRQKIDTLLYDRGEDATIGSLWAEPADSWLPGTGPCPAALHLEPDAELFGDGFFDAGAVSDGQTIYLPGWDGSAYAFDSRGQRVWKQALGEVADAGPALDGGRLYLQTWGREVLALDRSNGRPLWRFRYPESAHDDHRQGGLVRVGKQLLVPAWNGRLYALDAGSGKLLWKQDCGAPLRAAPAVARGRIFQPSGSGRLSILSLDGQLLTTLDLGAPLLSTPLVTAGGVILVTRGGDVLALDDDGRQLWRRDLAETCYYGAPVLSDGLLYLATAAGRLHCLTADRGEPLWSVDLAGPSYATPLIAGGRIFVGDNRGVMQVFNALNGDPLARADFTNAIQSTPLLIDGRLVFGARDSRIHFLRLRED